MEISKNLQGAKRAHRFEILVAGTKTWGLFNTVLLTKFKQNKDVYSLNGSNQFIAIHIPIQFHTRVQKLRSTANFHPLQRYCNIDLTIST